MIFTILFYLNNLIRSTEKSRKIIKIIFFYTRVILLQLLFFTVYVVLLLSCNFCFNYINFDLCDVKASLFKFSHDIRCIVMLILY